MIGTIEPHPQAGFGGGFKNLVPGLAGAQSIAHNHMLLPSPHDYSLVGSKPEQNPMRLDLEEAGSMVPGRTFLLNVVLDPSIQPIAVVCSDPEEAHRVGINIAREIYQVDLPYRVDAVIAGSHPMEQDLRQGRKAILNLVTACKPGGIIMTFLKCEDGFGKVNIPGVTLPIKFIRFLTRLIGSKGIYFLTQRLPKSIPGEDRFMVNLGLNILKDFNILIYSPNLFKNTGDRFSSFIFDDQDVMFEQAQKILRKNDPNNAIFSHGGVCYLPYNNRKVQENKKI